MPDGLSPNDVEVIARRVAREETSERLDGLHGKLEKIQSTLTGSNGDSFVTRLALLERAISRLETALDPPQISSEESNSGIFSREHIAGLQTEKAAADKEKAAARKEESALKQTRAQGLWGFLGIVMVQVAMLMALMMDKCN